MDESTLTGSEINDSLLTISDIEQPDVEPMEINQNALICQISALFSEIIELNKVEGNEILIDNFYTRVPKYSFEEFVRYLVAKTHIEMSTLICSVIYIDKICGEENYALSYHNIYRMFLASLLISYKFNEDNNPIDNKKYAKICGLFNEDLNNLEFLFFKRLNFSLLINTADFIRYRNYLTRNI